MRFHIMTLFPDMVMNALGCSITGRAMRNGLMEVKAWNIRDYAFNKHQSVDDYIYGGGAGLLMQAEPVYQTWKAICEFLAEERQETGPHPSYTEESQRTGLQSLHTDETLGTGLQSLLADGSQEADPYLLGKDEETVRRLAKETRQRGAEQGARGPRVIYLSPQGQPFTQRMAQELAGEEELILLCGHYEGIDERVLEEIVTDYVSAGDYVLTGGELPAMMVVDAVSRLIPGVLHNNDSAESESFQGDLLEYPQYSRPEIWHERQVPPILLSGHHANVEKWRREQSVIRTARWRPDLLEKAQLTEKERALAEEILKEEHSPAEGAESIPTGEPEGLGSADENGCCD